MNMLLGITLFWISIFGYLLFFREKTKLPYELLLPIIFSLIGIIMFLSGILNIMNITSLLLCFSGIVIFIYKLIKKEIEFKKLLNINFIILLIIFLYLTIVGSRMRLMHYDNFTHWGLIIKNMFLNSSLPNFESTMIEFKNYQPGSACFIYYFGFLTGKTEGSMIIAQNYLIISYFFSLLTFTNTKRKEYISKILLIVFYFFILFGNIRFNELLVDTLIATISICSLAVIYYFKDDLKKAFIYNLPILIFLFLVKNTGLVLVGFSCLGLIFLGFKNKQIKKGFMYAVITGIISISFFYIWSKHVSLVFGQAGLTSRHSLNVSSIINQLSATGTNKIIEFCKLYFNHFIDIFNNLPNKYMIGINIIVIVMLIVYKKYRKHFGICLIMLNTIYLIYYLILGAMYLFSMPWDNVNVNLAGFDRYMFTVVFIVIGLALIFFISVITQEKSISKKSIIVCISLMIIISFITFKYHVDDYSHLLGNLNYERSIPYKFDKILKTNNFSAEDNNFYYVYAPISSHNDSGYTYYVSKYKLNTINFLIVQDISQFQYIINSKYTKNIIVLDGDKEIYEYIEDNDYKIKNGLYVK